jgi:exosortase
MPLVLPGPSSTVEASPNTKKPPALVFSGVVVVLTLLLYYRVLLTLVHDWWIYDAQSYGLLIPPLAGYIAWLRRKVTLAEPVVPDLRGLIFVAGACMTLLVGTLGAEFFLTRLSFVLLLAGFVWVFWGIRRLKTLTFPFILLATMVPLPALIYNFLAAPLQLFASGVATSVSRAVGVTVYRDGNVIQLAHTSLGVAEACSGLRSLSALFIAGLLLGYLQCERFSARFLLVVLSVPLAIAVNVARVAGTAVLADYDTELAMGFYHSFAGWLVFLAGFGSLYLIAKLLNAATTQSWR